MVEKVITINPHGQKPIKLVLDWNEGWFQVSEDNIVASIEVPVSSILGNAICGTINFEEETDKN